VVLSSEFRKKKKKKKTANSLGNLSHYAGLKLLIEAAASTIPFDCGYHTSPYQWHSQLHGKTETAKKYVCHSHTVWWR
jgi:hypothetical protein